MGIMDMIFGVHEGVKKGNKHAKSSDWKYENLETTPVLHSGEYLSELGKDAKETWQKDAVYNHMVRYDVHDKGYKPYEKAKKSLRRKKYL